MEKFGVTIIIGAANASASLIETVNSIMENCQEQDIAAIYLVKPKAAAQACNDAIARLEEAYPGVVRGMEQTRPYVGGAIRDGFDCAVSSHLLLLPGDLAIDLGAVPFLIEKEKEMPQGIVKVSRWLLPHSFHNYGRLRKHLNACAQVFLRLLYRTKLTDLTNPVQIMPTALYRAIDWKELNFPFLIELVLCPLRLGIPIAEIPGACHGRADGKSNNSFWQTALYLRTALRIRVTKPQNILKPKERSAQ